MSAITEEERTRAAAALDIEKGRVQALEAKEQERKHRRNKSGSESSGSERDSVRSEAERLAAELHQNAPMRELARQRLNEQMTKHIA